MLMVHTTLLKNLKSIRKYGLLCSYSTQQRYAVWFHSPSANDWGETHVRMNKDAASKEVVHIYYDLPKSWLKKHGRKLYYVPRDVPSSMIVRVVKVTRIVEEISL